ncbi:MAG: leucine-rich repeat protein [Clostridiales bacterium]|nr:leucine-rich repeat protein [Clostridiales bacterium]
MNICKIRHELSRAIKSQAKRLSVVLLAVSIFLCAMPVLAPVSLATNSDDFTYELTDDASGYILTRIADSVSGKLTIPSAYNGKPVKKIDSHAFWLCTEVTELNIPETITDIGEFTNGNFSRLEAVNVDPENEFYCSENGVLFDKGKTLLISYPCAKSGTSYTIPGSVTVIGCMAFAGCDKLASVTVPSGITAVSDGAFTFCVKLKSINIPNTVTVIGEYAFSNCEALASLSIPASVKYIGGSAFTDTAWFKKLPNGVVYINNIAYTYKGVMLPGTKITIKDGTEVISNHAFEECERLKAITIPDSVEHLGYYAFNGCSALSSVTIGSGITEISAEDFIFCSNLREINISESNSALSSIDGVVFSKDKKSLILYPAGRSGKYTVPNGVETISAGAFTEVLNLTSVSIPDGVKQIESGAFFGCEQLSAVNIPNSVESIGMTVRLYSGGVLTDEVTAIVKGDLNGDGLIRATDARIALRAATGLESLTPEQNKAGALSGAQSPSASDARRILRAATGLERI